MDNIKILTNFPSAAMEAFMQIYNSKFSDKNPQDRWTPSHAASLLDYEDVKFLNQFLPISTHGIEIYYVSKMVKPHIDRGRKTALQIPIEIDPNASFVYSVRNSDMSKLIPVDSDFTPRKVSKTSTIVNNPSSWFYKWDEMLFEKYTMEYPILQNVSLPHGGASPKKDMIIFSVAYKIDYDEVCNKYSSWH